MNNDHFDTPGFRNAAPYINAHRERIFVIAFGGEAIADADFSSLIHDLALLHSLGVKLVIVHGARPQIEARLKSAGVEMQYHQGLRVTDAAALTAVKEAAGCVRVEIEARLSAGLANTPMSGMRLRVVSGNFVTARPLGVRDGIDFAYTGEVRKIDVDGIRQQLDRHNLVLLSPLGFSPTGEVFNLSAADVATMTAASLPADKLIFLTEDSGLRNGQRKAVRQLNLAQAQALLVSKRRLSEETRRDMEGAVSACLNGVRRVHLVNRRIDGALLKELYTRDGAGTLITAEAYEGQREAVIDDVGGILELIAPLEQSSALVRRSREQLELEIQRFDVLERDGMIIGCAALYPSADEGFGEIACLAVHPRYRAEGRGEMLLAQLERKATGMDLKQLFVLTTQTAHWFLERGFHEGTIKTLPLKRRDLYNYQRNSKIFYKALIKDDLSKS
ncbi:MAG: amino-acid N-acetyltransferase [Gammaproteobacteria bacterium]|nr:amino-acid N-acetyltransferase [Gammaproteobacteria bacterium]